MALIAVLLRGVVDILLMLNLQFGVTAVVVVVLTVAIVPQLRPLTLILTLIHLHL